MSQLVRSFPALRARLSADGRRVRVAVCRPADAHTLQAVLESVRLGFIHALLVGEYDATVLAQAPPAVRAEVECLPAADAAEAMQRAVQLVHDGAADVLMKGLVNSDDLLRHILNKQYGLRPAGAVITHAAVVSLPEVDRLLVLSDVAVIPTPTLEQRAAQLRYTTDLARTLGCACPRVALLHCTEKVSEAFPVTLDYVALRRRAAAGEWGEVLVDGPLDLLCALSPAGLADKGLSSALEGRADVLLVPDIEAGNVLYKALGLLVPGARFASGLCGTSHPVVLTSRGDSVDVKIDSLALAALRVLAAEA